MRFQHLQVARPEYYDRIQTTISRSYEQNAIGPHGLTERWSYTVPSGKLAYIDLAELSVVRVTAAAPVGNVIAQIRYTPSLGGGYPLPMIKMRDNTANGPAVNIVTPVGFAKDGDVLAGETQDSGTGGTVNYLVAIKAAEFAR